MRRRLQALARVVIVSTTAALMATSGVAAEGAAAVPTGSALRTALVLPVNWAAGNGSPAAPQDKTLLQVTSQIGAVDKRWYQSVSHGQFAGWRTRGVGPFTVEAPRMDPGGICADQFESDVRTRADQAAAAQGIKASAYSTVVYYFSTVVQCPWSGLSDGHVVWLNGNGGLTTPTSVQELGHTLQLGHGLALNCLDAQANKVALSSTCDIVRYGDPYNAMGSGSGSFSAIQQYDLGWLSGRMQDVPATGGTYTLQPLENADVSQQVLRMVDGAATLWLEYRQPLGVDSSLDPANAGVLVRQQLPDQGLKSFLLDMTPGSTQGFRDARMPTGSTWVNPLGTMKITVNSADAAGAQVTIESALPIVPNVRGRTVAGAGQALGGAGFAVGSLANVIDHSCNNIGLVMSQSPSAGARAPAGTRVNLWVGRRPPHACP